VDTTISSCVNRNQDALARYVSLRRTQVSLNSQLVSRLARPTVVGAAKRLGLWRGGELLLDSEGVWAALVDFCLYDCYLGGQNAIARYEAAADLAPGSDQDLVIEAMLRPSPLSLFRVERREQDVGVEVQDLLTDEIAFVMDQGLGRTASVGVYLATRLIRFRALDVNMTSGAALALEDVLAEGIAADVHTEIGKGAAKVLDKMNAQERSRIAVRILREALVEASAED
jgi:hypothetical protein